MSNINFTCPHCSYTTELAANTEGMKGNCPSCKAEVVVTPDNPETSIVPTANNLSGEVQKVIWKQPVVIGISLVGVIGVVVLFISLMFSGDDEQHAVKESHRVPAPIIPTPEPEPQPVVVGKPVPEPEPKMSADDQYWRGYGYQYGEGVPQDYKEALRWYRLAAEQGMAEAQYHLASMHATGKGVLSRLGLMEKWVAPPKTTLTDAEADLAFETVKEFLPEFDERNG